MSLVKNNLIYNEEKFEKLVKELREAPESISDDEAWDMADFILHEEKGLEIFMKNSKAIKDPQGWIADQIP